MNQARGQRRSFREDVLDGINEEPESRRWPALQADRDPQEKARALHRPACMRRLTARQWASGRVGEWARAWSACGGRHGKTVSTQAGRGGGTPGFNGRRVPPDWRHTRHPRRIRLWTLWTLRRALVIGSNAAYWWSVIKKAAVVSKSTSKPAVRKVTVAKAPSKGGKKR